jgi:hypothetical protein
VRKGGSRWSAALERGGEVLREGKSIRFAFIHAERDAYPVAVLCRVMQVARSGYDARSATAGARVT